MNILVVSLQVKYGNFIRLALRLSTTEGGVWFYLGHLPPLSLSFCPMNRFSKQWKKRLLCEPNEGPLSFLSDVSQKGTWNCWYGAVKYHLQHLEYLKVFAAEEGTPCGRMAPDSLKLIQDMLTCPVELLS
ncbi:hypothetical protein RRG08_051284 [Elysia crispata]|uniref:Uncharacterized protein n=1 Tax=Elysia crispata TaxID=231223 RepID=A0AAE0YB42_9GAST|nr:hypothetical protein RRG08_051284 [Elysia crispata]